MNKTIKEIYLEKVKENKGNISKTAKEIGENPRNLQIWFKSGKGSHHISEKLYKHFNLRMIDLL